MEYKVQEPEGGARGGFQSARSLVPRLHLLREGRSGAPSLNSWIVPQNEEHPIRSLKDYVITFWSILYRYCRLSSNDIYS